MAQDCEDTVRNEGLRVLFVPTAPSHAATHLLVAEELARRGHFARFVCRDGAVDSQYHVRPLLEAEPYGILDYCGPYDCDLDRDMPNLRTYPRIRRAVLAFLSHTSFDVAVLCNDSSALFDRIVVAFCRKNNRDVLLIQESVRPAHRIFSLRRQWAQFGLERMVATRVHLLGSRMTRSPLFRPGYGRSRCTMIATAGDRFRRQLVDEGVVANKIRVTGQPRLDLVRRTSQGPEKRDEKTGHRVLLFCSQPIPEPQLARELFRDIVLACDELDDVKLLVKLHPRDADIGEWLRLLPHNAGRSLLDVTKTRGLDWCLREADGMMTIASTTCLEAMAVGLPVALVNYLPISWYLPYDAMGAAISIAKKDELRDAIRRLLYDEPLRTSLCRHSEEVLRDELFLRDGASASRIVDFIEDECVGHC